MRPHVIISTAVSSLSANKLRTGLALLGIVIGVAAVISIMSVGRGAQEAITSNIEALGTNLLFVRPETFTGQSDSSLTLDDAYALLDPVFVSSVEAVAPEINSFGQIVAGRENATAQIIGVTASPPHYWSGRLHDH